MEETTINIPYICGTIFGIIARGFICGIFPAALSLKRGNVKYAKWSIVICMVVSLFFSFEICLIASIAMFIRILIKVPAPPREAVLEDIKNRLKNS